MNIFCTGQAHEEGVAAQCSEGREDQVRKIYFENLEIKLFFIILEREKLVAVKLKEDQK